MAAVKKITASNGRGSRIKTEDPGIAPGKQGKTKTSQPAREKAVSYRSPSPLEEKKEGRDIGHAAGLPEVHGNLPNTFTNSFVYLFPVDPYQIFSYWEINSAELDKIRIRLLGKYRHLTPTLRFFCDGGTELNSQKADSFFDLTIDLRAGKQYVDLWKSGRTCFAELGIKNEHNRFFSICRSNTIETPNDVPDFARLQCYASSPAHCDLSYMNDICFLSGISSMPNHNAR
jgi:hypothetical protein